MRANPIQTNFTAGEVSPLLKARVDTTKYANGCDLIKNMIIKPQGPAKRRPGSKYHVAAGIAGSKSRLIPLNNFYVAEFGVGFARLYTTAVSTSGNYPIGDFTTPYTEADLAKLSWDSVGNVMYIACEGYHPKKLHSPADFFGANGPPTGTRGWVFEDVPFKDGPYMSQIPYDVRMTLSNVSDTATMTSSLATQFDPATDVGDYIEFYQDGAWRLAKITAIPGGVPTNTCTVDIVDNVFIGLDPVVGLSDKAAETPRTPGVGDRNRTTVSVPNSNGFLRRAPVGFGATNRTIPSAPSNGLDPATPITIPAGAGPAALYSRVAGGTITSTHSQVFTRADVGKFIRRGVNDWCLMTAFVNDSEMTFNNAGVVMEVVAGGDSVSVTPGTRVITATCTASIGDILGGSFTDDEVFAATDVGRHMRFNFLGQQVWGKITVRTSSSVATIAFYDALPLDPQDARNLANNGVTDNWRWGSWCTRMGYPKAVCIHEQRTVWASSDDEPQTMWFSRSLDYETMSPTEPDSSVFDDNGFSYVLATSNPQKIQWIMSGTVLMAGTRTGEWQIRAAGSVNEPLTPTNIMAHPQTSGGSATTHAIRAGSAILHIDKTSKRVRELTYSFEQDSWVSRDLTIVSEHILRKHGGAIDLCYQQEPNSVVWVLCNDGTLVALSYVKDQEVAGWHWHTMEDNDSTAPVIESICTIEHATDMEDKLFMVVKRTINGSVVRYIESLSTEHFSTSSTDRVGFNYMDCNIVKTGMVGTTITGLNHLNGETVWVSKDGVFVGSGTVSANQVVIGGQDFTGATVMVGLKMYSYLKTLPPEGGSPFGTSQGKTKRVNKADIRLHGTVRFKHGLTPADALADTHVEEPGGQGQNLIFEGDHEINVNQDWQSDAGYTFLVDEPYPMTLVGYMPHLNTTG